MKSDLLFVGQIIWRPQEIIHHFVHRHSRAAVERVTDTQVATPPCCCFDCRKQIAKLRPDDAVRDLAEIYKLILQALHI